MTKSAVFCGFRHINEEIFNGELHFLCSVYMTGDYLHNVRSGLIHQVGWTLLTSKHRAFRLQWEQKILQLIHLESLQTKT